MPARLLLRTIAYKLRRGAGVPLRHPDKKATAFDIQAAARRFPGELETSPLFFTQGPLRGIPVALGSAGPHPVVEAAEAVGGSCTAPLKGRKAKVTAAQNRPRVKSKKVGRSLSN